MNTDVHKVTWFRAGDKWQALRRKREETLCSEKKRTEFLEQMINRYNDKIKLYIYALSLTQQYIYYINHLNSELNPICHLLTLLRAQYILRVSRIRVNGYQCRP
jgi:hypothetical protein